MVLRVTSTLVDTRACYCSAFLRVPLVGWWRLAVVLGKRPAASRLRPASVPVPAVSGVGVSWGDDHGIPDGISVSAPSRRLLPGGMCLPCRPPLAKAVPKYLVILETFRGSPLPSPPWPAPCLRSAQRRARGLEESRDAARDGFTGDIHTRNIQRECSCPGIAPAGADARLVSAA